MVPGKLEGSVLAPERLPAGGGNGHYNQGPKMTADRGLTVVDDTPEVRQRKGRSRVTNHKDLLPGIKGTSRAARRFRDLVSAFIADMGGLDQCSEIKLNLLRRLA